jgi:hypothetical protein
MNDILVELAKPFHPSRVTWKPGSVTKDKSKALAMAYADLRAYQDRLDAVCGMDWSLSYTPWGDRIICHLTVKGVTRSSTGEADARAEKNDIGGTAAEAQAMKRACAMFGLGRYLYELPAVWAEYDDGNKRFSEAGKSRLNGVIANHYQRFLNNQPASLAIEPEPDAEQSAANAELSTVLDELGAEVYGDKWPQVRAHNVKRLTGSDGSLNGHDLQKLIEGLKKLKAQSQKVTA